MQHFRRLCCVQLTVQWLERKVETGFNLELNTRGVLVAIEGFELLKQWSMVPKEIKNRMRQELCIQVRLWQVCWSRLRD
jgi:hypothetical protein